MIRRDRTQSADRLIAHLDTVLLVALCLATISCENAPVVFEEPVFVMGTAAQLKVLASTQVTAEPALQDAVEILRRIESVATTYSDSSEVARLEATDVWRPSPDLHSILTVAHRVHVKSNGAYDPSIGSLMELWGFQETPAVPVVSAVDSVLSLPGGLAPVEASLASRTWGHESGAWRVGRRRLDLGGVAKGYAVDLAADRLEEVLGSCLVNAGGDLAVRGVRADGAPWLIGVQDPRDPSRLFLKIRLSGRQAIATSGDYQRYFEQDGERFHHLLDPETGYPARGVRSVSVIAESCASADAWATAAFVAGAERGLAMLESIEGIEGVIVTEDKGELVQHRTTGFSVLVAEDL